MHTSKLQRAAKIISDLGSPTIVATLFLIGQPLLHPEVSWSQAFLAATFVTLIPTLALIAMRYRGIVGDRHVTVRPQRIPVLIAAAVSIVLGIGLLMLVQASTVLFQEIGGIFLGLAVCFALTLFWKVSIHSAVATYVVLAATAAFPIGGPVVALLFSAIIGWSRVQIGHHTSSQVLGGQIVGCVIYFARVFLVGG